MGGLHDLSLLHQAGKSGAGPVDGKPDRSVPSAISPTVLQSSTPLPSVASVSAGAGLHGLLTSVLSPAGGAPDAAVPSRPDTLDIPRSSPAGPGSVPVSGTPVIPSVVVPSVVAAPPAPTAGISPGRMAPPPAPAHNIFRELRAMAPDRLAVRLREDLAAVGYFIQDVVLHALMESLYSCRPLLLEGPPGAGKTHLAEKLAEAYRLPKAKLSCAEGIQREQALYSWNRALQQMYLAQERERGRCLDEIQPEIYGLSFLDAGPLLRAFSWGMEGRAGILIIDEIDKLNPGASDMLLEPFSEWSISIEYYSGPEIRLSDPATRPLVIMTSNDIRHGVSAPLRNRALYAYLTPPTLEERIRILHHNGASLSMEVFRAAVDILERIQLQLKLMDPPGLRKGAAFLQSLAQKKVSELTAAVLEQHLCYLTGNESDFKRLRNFIPSLIEQSHFPSPELKRLVEQHYAVVNNTVAESSPLVSQALVACHEITDQLDGLFTSICHDHSDHLPI